MSTERLDDADAMDDADQDADEIDEDEEIDEQADSLLLDEDEAAPNLIPEGHPQRVLAGRIEILEKIGEGGMGTVWRGVHLKLERIVAVKLLDETLQLRPDGRERFIREARALALLNHRNVVTIYDCDELPDGKLYLCMELLVGETLRDVIKRRQPLDPLEVIDIGLQVCDAVQVAHDHGILHRDLTPSNIIRLGDAAKTIKVVDWGLCKYLDLFYVRSTQKYPVPPGSRLVTPLGCRFGNPEYMAPEMILREHPDPPSYCTDVYALAVVLYELLTGRHPFVPGDRKRPRPVREILPHFEYDDLEATLRAALRYQAGERTPTMAELREGLELARDCLLGQRAPAPAAPAPPTTEEATSPVPVDTTEPVVAAAQVEASRVAPDVPPPDSPGAGAVHEARLQPSQAPAPAIPLLPRGRLASTALVAVLGLAVGVGVTLATRPDVQPAADQAALAARLDLERARTATAELRADRCETEAATRPSPTEPTTSSPTLPPAQPPASSPEHAAARVLAASRGATTRRSTAPQKFSDAMARLAPKVRACALKGGIPEGPITVQVRRQGGVIDSVKVLKFSKGHPSVVCIDEAIRKADLPRSDRAIEEFTFPK